ncbi:DUF433 domain-containing protein [Mesorhizobium sp. CA14]|uniref:DUF433 domain-containing protein n=1 Tax=Mesorhizobium sp. CA14 TaxID=2876642 RepID=UPI001CCFAD8E|nr:DUF433 domain-containing protein [Mesorhizobium sp. CA14]MBZ9850005.1 DUF433 domain-containing protein [Mesorhizobium sp. CA14]
MNHVCMNEERNPSASAARALLSLKEVVTLADVSEKRVRKDIERGVIVEPRITRLTDARIAFPWSYVVSFAAVYGNAHLDVEMRRVALSKLDRLIDGSWFKANPDVCVKFTRRAAASCDYMHVDIDKYVTLDMGRVLHQVAPRLNLYYCGFDRIEERDDVLGGEAVFKDSRLSVNHIGKMVESGEPVKNILEDYPYLNEDDVRFAHLYYRAHPMTGRPRASDSDDEADKHAEIDVG